MAYSSLSPDPSVNPRAHLRLIREEESPEYDADPPTDPAPMTAERSPTGAILNACGPTAVALYYIALDNVDAAMPNTYAILEDQMQLSTRQVQRVVKTMEEHGFLSVFRGVGRGKETVVTPIKCDRKGDTYVIHNQERVTESTTERVTSPPTPPVNVNGQEKEEVNTPKPPRAKRKPYTDGFDAFWAAYPRKVNRKKAAEAWDKLRPDAALLETMLSAIRCQRLADREAEFIPHPTTWLNGERWTDEPARPAKAKYEPNHPKNPRLFVG